MFDELEDDDIDLLPKDKTDDDEDQSRRPNIGEVSLSIALYLLWGYHN